MQHSSGTWKWSFLVASAGLTVIWYFFSWGVSRPFWILPTDVEMDFVFRGLAIARGVFFDHAFGVPVDALGALILNMFHISISDLDRFFPVAYAVGFISLLLGIAWQSKHLLSKLSWPLAVSVIWFFFLHPSARFYMNFWSAEMFVFTVGILAMVAFWRSLHVKERPSTSIFLAGFFAGIALSLKLYFIVWVVACAVGYWLFRRGIMRYALGVAVGAVLGFMPFFNNPKYIAQFFLSRAFHGSLFDLFVFNVRVTFDAAPMWLLSAVVIFAACVVTFLGMRKTLGLRDEKTIFTLVVTISIFGGMLSALLQQDAGTFSVAPGVAVRFFLPVALYVTVGLGILAQWYFQDVSRVISYSVLVVILSLLVFQSYRDRELLKLELATDTNMNAVIEEHMDIFTAEHGKPPRVLFGDMPRLPVAFRIGDQYTRGMFADDLAQRYPDEGYKNLGNPLVPDDLRGYDLAIFTSRMSSGSLKVAKNSGYEAVFTRDLVILNKLAARP